MGGKKKGRERVRKERMQRERKGKEEGLIKKGKGSMNYRDRQHSLY